MAVSAQMRPQLQEQTLVGQSFEIRVRRATAVHLQELHAHVQTETPPEESHDELRKRATGVQLSVLQQAVPAKSPPENAHGMRAQNHHVRGGGLAHRNAGKFPHGQCRDVAA